MVGGGNTNGGIIGGADTFNVTNDYYDINATTLGLGFCVGNEGDAAGLCQGVATSESNADYFKGNSSNTPLNHWNFGTTWSTVVNDYPTLQTFVGDFSAPLNFSSLSASTS